MRRGLPARVSGALAIGHDRAMDQPPARRLLPLVVQPTSALASAAKPGWRMTPEKAAMNTDPQGPLEADLSSTEGAAVAGGAGDIGKNAW